MSKEYMHDYYIKHKDTYKLKYNSPRLCECCNTSVKKQHWARHCRTAKHIAAASKAEPPAPHARLDAAVAALNALNVEATMLVTENKKITIEL